MYPKSLINLINYLKKLPGVGTKTAERFAFELIKWEKYELSDFGNLLSALKNQIKKCDTCGCLIENNCTFCDEAKRDTKKLCIVSSFRDVFLFENANLYNGIYHIVDNLLSPILGMNSDVLKLEKVKKRIENFKIEEVIIALDSTVEGDATSLYIKEELKSYSLKISRLAFGLPMGTSLDYIDGGTLTQAFVGRKTY